MLETVAVGSNTHTSRRWKKDIRFWVRHFNNCTNLLFANKKIYVLKYNEIVNWLWIQCLNWLEVNDNKGRSNTHFRHEATKVLQLFFFHSLIPQSIRFCILLVSANLYLQTNTEYLFSVCFCVLCVFF